MSNDTKTVNIKDSILNEQKEITVKTFFGHEITVRLGGSYEVLTGGIKGLIDKIIWFFFAPTLESRKAAVEESLKNNNSSTNEETKSNNVGEQDSHKKTITTSDDLNKTNQSLREKNTKMADNSDDSNFQLLSNEKDSTGNQTNINNDNRNNSSIKERESGNIYNEFSVFGNEDNDINFVEKQNFIKGSNIISSGSAILNDAEKLIKEGTLKDWNDVLNFLGKKGINIDKLSDNDGIKLTKLLDLVEANDKNKLTEEELALIKKSEKEAALEKEKAEEGFIEKMSDIIPKGYRVTSSKMGDKIKGDGNCFCRAIAKLENGNQEGYSEIRKTISDEINKSVELVGKSDYKIDDNLLHILQIYAGEYNELKDVEVAGNNLAMVLSQIEKYVEGKDKKNEYAGPIEAYFYAKATKKVVIIYDSNDQISVFIPDKDGSSVKVEYKDPKEIENYIKENKIDIANVVKLAYNAVGRHYEAIVQDVKN